MGIPEFWRYNGETCRIYQLQENGYTEVEASPTFPMVSKSRLYEFLAQARRDEVEAELSLRAWAQSQLGK